MPSYLCQYHDLDVDEWGGVNDDPKITCQACRADGYFTAEEVQDYISRTHKRVAVFWRPVGYPDRLHVIMNDQDSLFEAERIAPKATFRFSGIRWANPYIVSDNNTRILSKPPGRKTLEDIRDEWDHAPAYLREAQDSEEQASQSYVVNVTPVILEQLRIDYEEIYKISPEDFEVLVLNRLQAMGFEGQRVGATYARDGGVDIVFWPKPPFSMPFLAVAQVKHHRSDRRSTPVKDVREFAGVLRPPFQFGMIVTNTAFTADAHWAASQTSGLLRLRDMHDLSRWIASDFASEADWREIPRIVEVGPGIRVPLTIGNLILPEPSKT